MLEDLAAEVSGRPKGALLCSLWPSWESRALSWDLLGRSWGLWGLSGILLGLSWSERGSKMELKIVGLELRWPVNSTGTSPEDFGGSVGALEDRF